MSDVAPESNPTRPGPPPAADDRDLSRRPLRGDRRLFLWLVGVALLLGVAYFWLHHEKAPTGPVVSPLLYGLLTASVLVLVAVVYFLLRYLIRLLWERRAGILGSRFKFKLVVTVVALCLVPGTLIFVAAIVILQRAVDVALSPDVDRIMLNAKAISLQFYDDAEAGLQQDLDGVVEQARGHLADSEMDLASQLRPRLEQDKMAVARVEILATGQVVHVMVPSLAGNRNPLDPSELRAARLGDYLAGAARGERFVQKVPLGSKLYLVAGAPLPAADGSIAGTIVVARRIPKDLQGRVEDLQQMAADHARISAEASWVKWEHGLTFVWLLLVIMLGATWIGLYIARDITLPIQRLAEATVELRKGNLGHVVAWQGRDELADLVAAFNEMARDLRVKQGEVERKASELTDANLQLARVNDELERRRSHMAMLLDTMSAGVIAVDASGAVTVANRSARQILGLAEDSALGMPHGRFLAGTALAELREEVAQALSRRFVRRERATMLGLERGEVHLQVVLTSQQDASGGRGLLLLFEDVTELVRAQKLATWRQAARRIAHEIKNPLTPIQLSAQRMLKKWRERSSDFPSAFEGGVETIIAEVGGLKQLVDAFTDFARMPEVRPIPGDVSAMLKSVRALYAGHERLRVEVDCEPGLPPIPFDPELLRRCVVNLVDNAVEATGGVGHVVLSARLDAERGLVSLAVTDDGPGIPADVRDRLFLPYFTTREQGTGLGLAIVHRIVVDHGGRVRAESNRPHGARFVMELPLESPPREPGDAANGAGDEVDASRRRAEVP